MAGAVACGASSSKGQAEATSGPQEERRKEQTQPVVQHSEPASDPSAESQATVPDPERAAGQQQPIRKDQDGQQRLNKSNQQQSRQTMNQGIKGKVIFRQGNFMPSPDAPQQGSGRGVKRELYIHELTNMGQVQGEPPFYQQIQTKLVKKVVSDENGNFAVELKPGKYSLFVKEKDGYYANLFDGQTNIYPVEVQENQVTPVEFVIDYNATY
jgi:hypothetical protein